MSGGTRPLFLVGESYGTTRASALSGYMLQKYGVAFNGVVLMSTVLNFETLEFATGNDLPYVLFLPTYTATAWYHKKLDPSLQGDLQSTLRQAEAFADGPYADALAKGDRISAADRTSVIAGLAKFTGLSAHYIDLSNLRVDEPHFTKELLRDQRLNVGRLDSRYTGFEPSLVEAESETDPTMSIISSPFSASFHQYIRTELGYKSDDDYYLLGGGFSQERDWDWGSAAEGFPNVTRVAAEGIRRQSLHAALCCVRILRSGDALLCHRIHAGASGPGTVGDQPHLHGILRRRPHDVSEAIRAEEAP